MAQMQTAFQNFIKTSVSGCDQLEIFSPESVFPEICRLRRIIWLI